MTHTHTCTVILYVGGFLVQEKRKLYNCWSVIEAYENLKKRYGHRLVGIDFVCHQFEESIP